MASVPALDVAPDPETAAHLARAVVGPVVLWEAPFHPVVDGLRIVQAFHVLVTWRRPEAFLLMAGPDDDERHRDHLQTLVGELCLERTWLAANPSPARRAAFRARADLTLVPATLAAADRHVGSRVGSVALGHALADLLGGP